MQIYLVGGAVRDQLLGRKVIERDYVVVGATPQEMQAKGFRAVGKDFPVFLHPESAEEYALARTERKTGKGYTGFDCFADPSVTLEQDLLRRDLTINAMAQDADGNIIDPYNGQVDLRNKSLHHVSPAFCEDPVRILRIARFAARFADFTVHPDTNELMISMVNQGEVDALVTERVWKELSRALAEPAPTRFFEVLRDCQALSKLMPEIAHHESCMMYLQRSMAANHDAHLHFAALSIPLRANEITELCTRMRPPTQFADLAMLVSQHITQYQQLNLEDAETIIDFIEQCDGYRRPERFADFCAVAGLTLNTEAANKQRHLLLEALQLTQKMDAQDFIKQGLQGKAIAEAIHHARIQKLLA